MNHHKPIPIGLVGLGWVGLNRHVKAIRAHAGLELIGVADRNADQAAAIGARLGVPHCAAERIEDIAWLNQASAIDIATSPMSHEALIQQALDQGKHVITEKPFCMHLAAGERLVGLAAAKNLQLAIVHNFQFASSTTALKADMASGRLGTVRSISAVQWGNPSRRLPVWYEELPLGLFFDESPHLLYLIRALAPGVLTLRHVEHYRSTMGLKTPACIDAHYEAASGIGPIPVSLSCRFESPLSEWHVSVHADHGVGIIDVFRDIYVFVPNDRQHETLNVLGTSWRTTLQHWLGYVRNGPLHLTGRLLYGNETVFARFETAMRSGQAAAGISGEDALQVLRMQHDIIQASHRR